MNDPMIALMIRKSNPLSLKNVVVTLFDVLSPDVVALIIMSISTVLAKEPLELFIKPLRKPQRMSLL